MSLILDSNPEMAEAVHADLVRGVRPETGRKGLSGDQVVRAALLYQSKGWSFEELVFELAYHAAYRHFCRLSFSQQPSKSALSRDIGRIRPETWARIQDIVMRHAIRAGIEDGSRVRTDCTVTEVNRIS